MEMSIFVIQWDSGQSAEFATLEEMDRCINDLENQFDCEPIIAIVGGPNETSVYFGVGGALSFISACDPPYKTTVGNPDAEGDRDYYHQGHHSSIANRNLVPREFARKALHEFCLTGQFANWQAWEEV